MTIAVQIIAILFMVTLMFIGIWTFVIANKAYKQVKYKNYLLEKIANRLSIITEAVYDDKNTIKKFNKKLSEEEEVRKDIEDILVKENKLDENSSNQNSSLDEDTISNDDIEEMKNISDEVVENNSQTEDNTKK
ncbi:hypothetical protein [Clostridium mediterraneense]|uniref:hypothetical protein n=1 Tax=Clostridium mediterraneense TaxID=1805472 RepID=UPI00082E4D27|nr:hypothetical protein [Clostridium mediterraneense]